MLAMSMLQARRQDPPTLPSDTGSKYWVHVGTVAYNGAPSNKLYVCSFDANSGKLKVERLAAETDNPGVLAVHPTKR
jgi:6-phosphogluconolactonase (cycloisomerase 2 family)